MTRKRRWSRLAAQAEKAMARNKRRIEAGMTFAGHQQSDWRLGQKREEPRR